MTDVHMLWVGGNLGKLELLAVRSFLKHGYKVNLWSYDRLSNSPIGVIERDADEVLPRSGIFLNGRGSYASFADLFRYTVLSSQGGMWADTDVIALAPPESIPKQAFIATEHAPPAVGLWSRGSRLLKTSLGRGPGNVINVNVIFNPEPRAGDLIDVARAVAERFPKDKMMWGEIGPRLLSMLVEYYQGHGFLLMEPVFANHIPWWECPSALLAPARPLPREACFLHCYNEMWRRAGVDKNLPYPEGSLLQQVTDDCL